MLISEVMNDAVESVRPTATAREVAQAMERAAVGAVVISDAEDSKPQGIITDRDLAVRVLAAGLGADTPVEKVMSPDVVCCDAAEPVAEALRLMRNHDLRRLPVVAGTRLVGLISLSDIAAKAEEMDEVNITLIDLCELRVKHDKSDADHDRQEQRHP